VILDVVISSHPLSSSFRELLAERLASSPDFVQLSQLRILSPLGIVSRLRAPSARRCIVAIEQPGGYTLLPVLQLLALVTGASEMEIVHPDFRRESVTRLRAVLSIGGLLAASLDGLSARRIHRRGMRELVNKPRASVNLRSNHKVLYLNPNLWFGARVGGAISHMTGVVNGLADLGYRVDVASATPLSLRTGAQNHLLALPERLGLPEETNYFRFQRHMLRELRALTRANEYDFIYQRLSIHNYAGALLSRLVGLPLVLEYNGSEVWAGENWGRPVRSRELAVLAEEVCLRHAHLVVVVSEALRREVVARGVEPHRVVQYPNGFDPALFSPSRFEADEIAACRLGLGIPPEAVVATFVGTFGKWHGVDVLAKAIRRLVDEDPDWVTSNNVRFLLIGDGARMAEVRKTLGEISGGVVVLTGLLPPSAVPLHLAASDILLAPHVANDDGSEFFGSPTKLFEYMAMSKAILASKLGQIADVLAPSALVSDLGLDSIPDEPSDDLALLFTPNSPEELTHGLRALVAHPVWRKRLGELALRRAVDRHTWRRHVSEIVAGLQVVFNPRA
jgi:glycosyltransferase involved in cell wall biosynthesis